MPIKTIAFSVALIGAFAVGWAPAPVTAAGLPGAFRPPPQGASAVHERHWRPGQPHVVEVNGFRRKHRHRHHRHFRRHHRHRHHFQWRFYWYEPHSYHRHRHYRHHHGHRYYGHHHSGGNELAGALIGGALGAVIGSELGHGHGRGAAIVGGAVVGAIIGSHIGRAMDEADHHHAAQVLETSRTGHTVEWRNPDTGNRYAMTPTRTYRDPRGLDCREYTIRGWIGGDEETLHGTACRMPDGAWRLVS